MVGKTGHRDGVGAVSTNAPEQVHVSAGEARLASLGGVASTSTWANAIDFRRLIVVAGDSLARHTP
jgi:hypothetical protein